jgi:hypothetical protein
MILNILKFRKFQIFDGGFVGESEVPPTASLTEAFERFTLKRGAMSDSNVCKRLPINLLDTLY